MSTQSLPPAVLTAAITIVGTETCIAMPASTGSIGRNVGENEAGEAKDCNELHSQLREMK
jgi:hypothetical protein